MTIIDQEGTISIRPATDRDYVGVYQPRDGRDQLLLHVARDRHQSVAGDSARAPQIK